MTLNIPWRDSLVHFGYGSRDDLSSGGLRGGGHIKAQVFESPFYHIKIEVK